MQTASRVSAIASLRWPTIGDRGAIKVLAGDDELVLSERPRLWLLLAFVLVALLAAPMVVGGLSGLVAYYPQHLVCDRTRDICERDDVPIAPLHDVASVELTERAVRSGRTALGYFKSVTLVLHDGTRKNASDAEAQADSSVAEYSAAVDAIRAFLSDPSQQRVETTFTYRPSWSERLYSAIGSMTPVCFVLALFSLWPGSSYTFIPVQGTIIAKNGKRFGKKLTFELPMDEIANIGDRGRAVDLELLDGSRILLARVRHGRLPAMLLPTLQKVLGKPIR
jgi:hypothetical protein